MLLTDFNIRNSDVLRKHLQEIETLAKFRNTLAHNPLEITTVIDSKNGEIVSSKAMIRSSKADDDMNVAVREIETKAKRADRLYGELTQAINEAKLRPQSAH